MLIVFRSMLFVGLVINKHAHFVLYTMGMLQYLLPNAFLFLPSKDHVLKSFDILG